MNEQNNQYLKDRLQYHGFGNQFNKELDQNMKAGKENFKLSFPGQFSNGGKKDVVHYEAEFARSEKTGNYFWNNYKATLKNDDPAKERSHQFPIRNGNGISGTKAYHMLQGNPVYQKFYKPKEDGQQKPEAYHAWAQIDFSQKDKYGNNKMNYYNDKYGFDLEKSLGKIPIKDFDQKKEGIMNAMRRGEQPQVTVIENNTEKTRILKADPKYKSVLMYDQEGKQMSQGPGGIKRHTPEGTEPAKGTAQGNTSQQQNGQSVHHQNKNEAKAVSPPVEEKRETRTRSRGMSR